MSFPKYPKYKDSGVRWLGEVPEHWEVLPLKKMATLITGITPPTNDPANYVEENGFPWIRPEDIKENTNFSTASKFLSQKGEEYVRKIPAQSTLICGIGTIGKVGFITELASTNQQITAVDFHEDKRYCYYISKASAEEMNAVATGNVVRILNNEKLGAVIYPKPSIVEQTAIANFLDQETAKIDALVAEQEKLITLLKEKRQALISHAVTKGLNPNVLMKDSGVEWLGEVPVHWEVKRLKKSLLLLTEKATEKTNPIALENIENWSGQYIQTETEFDGDGIIFEKGDILFGKLRPYLAKVLLAKTSGEAVGDFHVLRPKEDICSEYAQYQILNNRFIDIVNGATFGSKMPRVSWDFMGNLPIVVPSITEQATIVNFLNRETTKIDDLVTEAQSAITLLQERRSTLISAAVTGKIDVRSIKIQETV